MEGFLAAELGAVEEVCLGAWWWWWQRRIIIILRVYARRWLWWWWTDDGPGHDGGGGLEVVDDLSPRGLGCCCWPDEEGHEPRGLHYYSRGAEFCWQVYILFVHDGKFDLLMKEFAGDASELFGGVRDGFWA